MDHKLLILGSMDEFVGLTQKSVARGYETFVCDGYNFGPAKRFADHSYNIDIRNVEKIAALIREEKIDGIISSFSDILFEYLVKIADLTGLKTYCSVEKSAYLRDKPKMKEMFEKLGVPFAKSRIFTSVPGENDIAGLKAPLVMKPLDGYGSRGIFVVGSAKEIAERFNTTAGYSSDKKTVIVEEYNDGYEINMMNWVVDGEVHVISLADREKSVEIKGDIPHVSRIAYPSRIMEHVYSDAREIVSKVAEYTGIKNGPLCMQFFYRPGDGIRVCECAGRIFGYEHELVEYGSGLAIEDLLLDYVYDEENIKTRLSGHDPFAFKNVAGLYFHGFEGKVTWSFDEAKKVIDSLGAIDHLFYYTKGEAICHEIGNTSYILRVFIGGQNRDDLDALTNKYYDQMRVLDKDGKNVLYSSQMKEYDL
ncbi:MAG: ATP-grasp domain-containing protein [Lachnospiraceae bacterium]|nr:ATP-grasp domain-containing protein [Lachnospiraceae bacterium]